MYYNFSFLDINQDKFLFKKSKYTDKNENILVNNM